MQCQNSIISPIQSRMLKSYGFFFFIFKVESRMRFPKSKVARKSRMPLKRTEMPLESILEFWMNNSSLKVLKCLESTKNDVLERPSVLIKVVN